MTLYICASLHDYLKFSSFKLFESYYITISCLLLNISHILLSFHSSPFCFFFVISSNLFPFTSCRLLFFFDLCSVFLHHQPAQSSAHVDMSTVAFDVDPLDLDAEEPPESQGDPRSSKGMSGSVTSPQANAHRLPFFKKVTLGAQEIILTSPGVISPSLPNFSLAAHNLTIPAAKSNPVWPLGLQSGWLC